MTSQLQTAYAGGSSSGLVFTTQNPGESTADWVDRHLDAACLAAPRGTTTLTTSWECGGANEQVQTVRNTGESYLDFWKRHADQVKADTASCPPD